MMDEKKKGAVILIAGSRGMGKSYTAKSLLKKVHPDARLVLDPQAEYGDLYNRPPMTFENFERAMLQVKNAVILVEEATIFLSNRGYNNNVVDLLVSSRHRGNTIIFVYHTLKDIPKYIYGLANSIILLKTNDIADDIKKRFGDDKLLTKFLELKAMPLLKTQNGREYSPQIYINLYS